jgi:hypothetical protein
MLVNLMGGDFMDGRDIAIPVNDAFTVNIESQMDRPAPRAWRLRVTVTTSVVPENFEDNTHPYLHEVSDDGAAFVDEWTELVEDIDWLADTSWNFLIGDAYNCGDGAQMATYTERVSVNAEDVLASLPGDKQLVRVSYTVPREMYAIVADDVDVADPQEVAGQVSNLGFAELPVVTLEPEMVRPKYLPSSHVDIPSVDIDEVDDLSVEVVDATNEQ